MEIVQAKRPYIKGVAGSVFLDVFHGIAINEWGESDKPWEVYVVLRGSQQSIKVGEFKAKEDAHKYADEIMELASSFDAYQNPNNLFG